MQLDPELLKTLIETFKTELDEQLQVITAGLLELEKGTISGEERTKVIDNIFRGAHNIKGASRSLSIVEVGQIAHRIESLFSGMQSNTVEVTSKLIDVCLEAVDKMRLAMLAFLNKKPIDFDLEDLLKRMEISSSIENQAEAPVPTISETQTVPQDKKESPAQQVEDNEIKFDKHTTDSIRIPVKKIEKLSALLEEMQANKIIIEEYYLKITELHNHSQDLSGHWKHFKRASLTQENGTTQKSEDKINDTVTEMINLINGLHKNMRIAVDKLGLTTTVLGDEVRSLRLIPVSTLLYTMPRYIRDLSKELNKQVELRITGSETKIDKVILDQLKDPIIHILRNAVDHGIEEESVRKSSNKPATAKISIDIHEENNQIIFAISDDGSGIDIEKIKQIAIAKKIINQADLDMMDDEEVLDILFRPGFSTKKIITSISGRGVGLDVVKENITDLKGTVIIKTTLGKGTTFEIRVPLTLSSENGLLVASSSQSFVIPTSYTKRVLVLSSNEIQHVEGIQAIHLDNQTIPLFSLADLLNLEQKQIVDLEKLFIVIIKKGSTNIAVLVDEIIGEREIVIKPLQPPMHKSKYIAGGTLSGNNEVIVVLNPNALINAAMTLSSRRRLELEEPTHKETKRPAILVVDDSITTRTLEKNILESRDYEVTVAVNGKEAWDILQKQSFALIVTDVTMPIMDGFTLTERIKQSDNLKKTPVIIVTSLGSDAEKKRGMEVGADAYIVKNEFESGTLLEIVEQLV